MNKFFAVTFLIGIVGSAGCASTAETEAYQKSRVSKAADNDALTGSRLVKPTTERMVNAVGNKDYKESTQHTGIANRVGAPGN